MNQDGIRAFILRWAAACNYARMPTSGFPLPTSVRDFVIAHGGHESGWGAGKACRQGKNPWNLTRSPRDDRPVVHGGDQEFTPDGKVRHIIQRFRAYASDVEAVEDYLCFLADSRRYGPAWGALLAGDAEGFPKALRDDDPETAWIEGGFYTSPLVPYRRGFLDALTLTRKVLAAPPLMVCHEPAKGTA